MPRLPLGDFHSNKMLQFLTDENKDQTTLSLSLLKYDQSCVENKTSYYKAN